MVEAQRHNVRVGLGTDVAGGYSPSLLVNCRHAVLSLLEGVCEPVCLGVTKAGLPKHPLYLRADAPFVPYTAPSEWPVLAK